MWLFDLVKCFALPLEFDKGLRVFSLLVQATHMSLDELLQQSDPTPWKEEPVSPKEKRHTLGVAATLIVNSVILQQTNSSPSLMKCKSGLCCFGSAHFCLSLGHVWSSRLQPVMVVSKNVHLQHGNSSPKTLPRNKF
jgi:hypothetical protein